MEELFRQGDIYGYLEVDEDINNPFEDFDQLGTLVTWHKRSSFGGVDGHKEYGEPKNFTDEAKEKGYLYLPVYLYEHSGQTVSTTPFSCPWDSGQLGYIYTTPKKIKEGYGDNPKAEEHAKRCMEIEVETLDQYLTGDVWGVIIQKETECGECGQKKVEHLDSCWGYYGREYAEAQCKEMFDYAVKEVEAE